MFTDDIISDDLAGTNNKVPIIKQPLSGVQEVGTMKLTSLPTGVILHVFLSLNQLFSKQ